MQERYCESIYQTVRRPTREVLIGGVGVGGQNPVRIQSMTTSSTRDVDATTRQIMRLADVGCEIARITVQGIKEAEACEKIKNSLLQKGYKIPLVADIHFYPPAALKAADFVDKVRINPGNFADKRATFKTISYTESSYTKELLRIEEKFAPLVEKCKANKLALRIGVNHGSLSDRIMNRCGDTPEGMVESALEFARICQKMDFHNFLFSMKASNPLVMIQAYRLLAKKMYCLGWDYPLHLGVTEAGDGEDGRVKSAIGMGALLLDGLGDTVRVSLTEDPWYEIDPCKRLVSFASSLIGSRTHAFQETFRSYYEVKKREVELIAPLHRDGTVASFHEIDVDYVVHNAASLQRSRFTAPIGGSAYIIDEDSEPYWEQLSVCKTAILLLRPKKDKVHFARRFFEWITSQGLKHPLLLAFSYDLPKEDLMIAASADSGALLADGIGEGLLLDGPYDPEFLKKLSFNILQGVRMRLTRTDFISCPSCGRTLFNLQEVTHRIRERTAHLPGVKIAIMGCIVNGPGEMADAHFGYVGSRPGKIDLYIGKKCVEKNIDFADADERLITLIKESGMWLEPALSS